MILDIMTTQLIINFRSDPLEEMCKVLQKNLMKYIMNLVKTKKMKSHLKKSLLHWQLDDSGTTDFKH